MKLGQYPFPRNFFAVAFSVSCHSVSGQADICLLGEDTLPTSPNPNYSHGRPSQGAPGRLPGRSLDERGSLDSVQQALFSAHAADKKSTVVIYDTDGKVGQDEHRIKIACDMAEVTFFLVPYPPPEACDAD